MINEKLYLGIDLGTSGVRIAIINKQKHLIYNSSLEYSLGIEYCDDWKNTCKTLILNIPNDLKNNLVACSIDGTSGTLLACNYQGQELGKAIPYYNSCHTEESKNQTINYYNKSIFKRYNSITRANLLKKRYGEKILLRHQADWITGWFLNNWLYGEEGNNIKLGWNNIKKEWIPELKELNLRSQLPKIIPSGEIIGNISRSTAKEMNLPKELKIVAGTTDSNAAVLAANALREEGVTILGSTIVVKCFTDIPIKGDGITNHRIGQKWLSGGASNAGGAVLKRFFTDQDLIDLSRQINPEMESGLNYRPLAYKGERFPISDPKLEPIITPRPISDALYLHGLLEGLANIEAKAWEKLAQMGASKPKKLITIGGGARNPQWRRIREKIIGVPIVSSNAMPAEGMASLALEALKT